MYGEKVDFYTLKGVVEELLAAVGVTEYDVAACADEPAYHPGRCARVAVGNDNDIIALLGEIHPLVQAKYGIDARVCAAEVNLELLQKNARLEKQYRPLPKFPATTRDLAVTCSEETPVLELEKAIKTAAGGVLESITLFDIYRGRQVPEGQKSAAFSIALRAQDRTLTDDEADSTMKAVIAALAELGAVLRA
jgi:phenylalanyl-tRNA synthetase beta chain